MLKTGKIGNIMIKVITYGTYDLLHYGHIRLLKRAKQRGDYLVVALSTDEFNKIKGKKAYHDYFVLEEYEAGIELVGTEVKSIRLGGVNLKDSWCSVDHGELYIRGMHVSPYEKGNIFNRDPMRVRKLLMHKKEISKLYGTLKQDGLSLIPLSLYFRDSILFQALRRRATLSCRLFTEE